MNELINYGGDCRTAPATPGLLNILKKQYYNGNHKKNQGVYFLQLWLSHLATQGPGLSSSSGQATEARLVRLVSRAESTLGRQWEMIHWNWAINKDFTVPGYTAIWHLLGLGRGTTRFCLPGGKGKCRQIHPTWLVYTFPFLQANQAE